MEVKGVFVINNEAYSCNVTPPLCMNALPCLHTHTEKEKKKTGVWRRTDECLPSEHRATVVVVAVEESDSSHTGG